MKVAKIAHPGETLTDLKELYDLWLKFRKYYLKSFTTEPISREDEQRFLEIKSSIAKYHRVLSDEIHESLYFAGDKIIELLRKSISVGHLRSLPLVDKQLYYKTWHYIFLHIGRTVGAYQFITEGFVPPKKAGKKDEGVTISGLKSMAGSAGEGKKKKPKNTAGKIFGVIVLLIIAVIVVIVVSQR